jgi:hypothetical protein
MDAVDERIRRGNERRAVTHADDRGVVPDADLGATRRQPAAELVDQAELAEVGQVHLITVTGLIADTGPHARDRLWCR